MRGCPSAATSSVFVGRPLAAARSAPTTLRSTRALDGGRAAVSGGRCRDDDGRGGGERVDDDEHEYEDERYSCSAIRTQGKSIFFLWATLMNGQKRQVKMAEIAEIDLRKLLTE